MTDGPWGRGGEWGRRAVPYEELWLFWKGWGKGSWNVGGTPSLGEWGRGTLDFAGEPPVSKWLSEPNCRGQAKDALAGSFYGQLMRAP